MAVFDTIDFQHTLPETGRLLGIDLGEKRVGIATSDTTRRIATPLEILARDSWKKISAALLARCAEKQVVGLVVGWPRNMEGSEGRRCQATRDFVSNFLKLQDLPTLFWDERVSTQAANRLLLDDMDLSRQKRRQVLDAVAASWILQGALDALRRIEPGAHT